MDWILIALGVACFFFALLFFTAGVFAIPGNPGPYDPMRLAAPMCWLAALGSAIAGVLGILFGIGWLTPDPGGFWRGETFVAAPFVLLALVILVLADSLRVRLAVIAIAALVYWAWQFSAFQQVLFGALIGLLG